MPIASLRFSPPEMPAHTVVQGVLSLDALGSSAAPKIGVKAQEKNRMLCISVEF